MAEPPGDPGDPPDAAVDDLKKVLEFAVFRMDRSDAHLANDISILHGSNNYLMANVQRLLDKETARLHVLALPFKDTDPAHATLTIILVTGITNSVPFFKIMFGEPPSPEELTPEYIQAVQSIYAAQPAGHKQSPAYRAQSSPEKFFERAKGRLGLDARAAWRSIVTASNSATTFELIGKLIGGGKAVAPFLVGQICLQLGLLFGPTVFNENEFIVVGPGAKQGLTLLANIPGGTDMDK
eukprot:SAG22_NODE_4397_length_1282_cov_6.540152_1_plen_238_part_10